jgi:hypothetical protein
MVRNESDPHDAEKRPALKARGFKKRKSSMHHNRIAAVGAIIFGVSLAFWSCMYSGEGQPPARNGEAAKETGKKNEPLDRYTIKGMTFAYYLVPSALGPEDLIAAAQALHHGEPKAQLILVDDTRQLKEYINYAKEFSRGNLDAYFPTEWAKQHVIANVQKFISGKYKLCRGMGVDEIADLK